MRDKMPNRRPGETFKLVWNGTTYHCTIGVYPDMHIGEIFVKGGKDGSDLRLILDDAFVLVSLLLQSGYTPVQIWDSLGRLSDQGTGARSAQAASLIGAVVDALIERSRV